MDIEKINIDEIMCRQTELTVMGWNRELTDDELDELSKLNKILISYDDYRMSQIQKDKEIKKQQKEERKLLSRQINKDTYYTNNKTNAKSFSERAGLR
jgi:hypothetical protein